MIPKSNRFTLVFTLFFLGYLAILARLFYFQVIYAAPLKEAGRIQSSDSLPIEPIRGEIQTSDGFPIAANSLSYLLYLNPKLIENTNLTTSMLAKTLEVEEASVSARIDEDLFWVKIAEGIDEKKKKEIESLKLKAVGFQILADRYYPESSMAAQLIGFVGKDKDGDDKGYFGVEGYYNKQLEGRAGLLYAVKDALGNPVLSDIREEKKIDGRNIKLSIDRTIQYHAEERLKNGIERFDAQGGSVIIMNPKTGKILAMASFPQFDPQTYENFPQETYKNPVISSVYEPGSTFKVLIMASGIDAGLIRPDTKCTICDGPIQIGEYSIKTWNNKYYDNTTMTEVIEHSDNTGMVFVGRKLGLDKMISYLEKFGINSTANIDLQGEISGSIRPKEEWREVDLATASFGQGISITPLQLIAAVGGIANDGVMMQPQVVDEIETGDGEIIHIKPKEKGRVIKKKTAKEVAMMMVSAVEKGDSKWVQLEGYKVAGKTGTAQIPVAGHYDPNQTIASFVGFFPAYDPEIVMLVLIDRPKSSIYGSETAAPVFFEIARDIVNYLNLPKDI